jgi:1-acylglycerone phosphate reductase
MAAFKRTVLITGCSDGGTGAELAKAFHRLDFHVYATARNTSKMRSLQELGIQLLPLDVQSKSSIDACVAQIPRLDILVNNAGASYTMPITDLSLEKAKDIFDLNVWTQIAVIQAFLPLLIKSPRAIIANHTSIGTDMSVPFQSVYNASKAAATKFTDTLRMELQPFDIAVVELKTGGVRTNLIANLQASSPTLPQNSIYAPARSILNKALRIEWFEGKGMPAEQWAKEVAGDLAKTNVPDRVWRGESARMMWLLGFFPIFNLNAMLRRMTGLNEVEAIIRNDRAVSGLDKQK